MRLARRLAAIALVMLIVGGVVGARQETAGQPQRPAAQPAPAAPLPDDRDARETRQQLDAILERYPPAIGRVFKMDPSLLSNPGYLSAYPALASFLAAHPEVIHNPGYFLSVVEGADGSWQPEDAKTATIAMWRNMFEGVGVFAIFLTVTGSLIMKARSTGGTRCSRLPLTWRATAGGAGARIRSPVRPVPSRISLSPATARHRTPKHGPTSAGRWDGSSHGNAGCCGWRTGRDGRIARSPARWDCGRRASSRCCSARGAGWPACCVRAPPAPGRSGDERPRLLVGAGRSRRSRVAPVAGPL